MDDSAPITTVTAELQNQSQSAPHRQLNPDNRPIVVVKRPRPPTLTEPPAKRTNPAYYPLFRVRTRQLADDVTEVRMEMSDVTDELAKATAPIAKLPTPAMNNTNKAATPASGGSRKLVIRNMKGRT